MQAIELEGGFSTPAQDSARAFRQIMTVMANPGRIECIEGAAAPEPLSKAAATLLLTLCDPETRIFLAGEVDVAPVRNWINFHIGAPLVDAQSCDFAVGTWQDLAPLSQYKIGTADYPDRSASLVVQSDMLEVQGAVLQGPGIKDRAALSLPEIAAFQSNHKQFPLGLDFYFTCGERIAALPRTTEVR
ncbi:MAG: phosphonate C-P lyase system protein PhnH [Cognatishimia sp.]|uniref:phosphonate C-P lyase system protein PhnH n=1 Tax=Cognatishimia sp. TaxID=2211648 RepID=UPI003B8B481A